MLKELFNRFIPSSPKHGVNNTIIVQSQKIYLFEPNQKALEGIMNAPFPEGASPGFVYFVQEHMNGTFKIGKTKHIKKRMNLFHVKLPFENKLVHLIKCGNHHQTEVAFHKYFKNKRLEGEWFNLSIDDINWIKNGKFPLEINQAIRSSSSYNLLDKNSNGDDKPLSVKQVRYAKDLIKKLEQNYELAIDYSSLTWEDLNRLSAYFKYKNIGTLNNLVKKGVLRPK